MLAGAAESRQSKTAGRVSACAGEFNKSEPALISARPKAIARRALFLFSQLGDMVFISFQG
jgi:hypothetical protein